MLAGASLCAVLSAVPAAWAADSPDLSKVDRRIAKEPVWRQGHLLHFGFDLGPSEMTTCFLCGKASGRARGGRSALGAA
jgi:hypothetical protein